MTWRIANRRIALLVMFLAGVVTTGAESESASTPAFSEGVHYVKLPVPVETRDPSRIEVVEVFSYNCIHCYNLERNLEGWVATQEEDVDFHRIPLVSMRSPPSVTLAQAYFTAATLDVLPSVHMELFRAIHDHGLDMTRPAYIRRLFEREAEVSDEEFQRVFDSFGIRSRVRQADGQGRVYRVMATPTLVVNGRFTVEAIPGVGGAGMLRVVNHLVAQERKARAEAAAADAAE